MAEVQKTTESGETAQHFIQFVIMHQQQALLALGKHPNPPPRRSAAKPAVGPGVH